jgi:hypothetical protein
MRGVARAAYGVLGVAVVLLSSFVRFPLAFRFAALKFTRPFPVMHLFGVLLCATVKLRVGYDQAEPHQQLI